MEHSNFGGMKGLAKRMILPRWLRRYDTWHPVGSLALEYLETISDVKKPTFLFPYSVDVEWFVRESDKVRRQRSESRQRLGLADTDFVVLGIMKWHEREDPLTLLRAFARLNQRHQNSRLVLVGDGPLNREVNKLASRMSDAVVLPGYQPYSALPRFFALSDVFVHPAPDEPWGVSVQEAMACSVPVVVAEGVGARIELVAEGKTGFVFPNGNDKVLAILLEELLLQPGQIQKMGDQSLQKARDFDYRFSATQMMAALGAFD
jgi:glycosyltransferase involved in cell wall biosynthesis